MCIEVAMYYVLHLCTVYLEGCTMYYASLQLSVAV